MPSGNNIISSRALRSDVEGTPILKTKRETETERKREREREREREKQRETDRERESRREIHIIGPL